MANGKRVRVVKHAERDVTQSVRTEKGTAVVHDSGETVKRDAVSVISEWVRELRRKKVEEAARGFEGLFRKAA